MKFPQATIGDLQVRVLLVRPDMSRGRRLRVEHRIDTLIAEGRTGIDERRPARATQLLTQTCTLFVAGNEADDWRKGLAALANRPVAVPLWIDALPVARWAERIYDPQMVINFDPVTDSFDIIEASELPLDLDELNLPLLAPLLVGRWEKRPSVDAITKLIGDNIEVQIEEASPYSCRIGVHEYGSSWSAQPDRSTPPKETSDHALELIRLSAAREPGLDRVNVATRMQQEGDFIFRSRLEIRQHLTFFAARRGAWESWSPVPAFLQTGADTESTPHNYTARFGSDALALEYTSGATARARVGFIQEIDTGERSQALPGETFLYSFTYAHDTGNPELLTAWDAPLEGTEGTFNPAQLAHQEIIRSLRPQDVKAEITMAFVSGSLAHDFYRSRLYGPLTLKIWSCDPDDVGDSRVLLFSGQVIDVLPAGNSWRVQAALPGDILRKRLGGWTFGPRCNTVVFSSICGLVESEHDTAGTIARDDLSSDGLTLTIPDASGWGGDTFEENWFSGGILRTGTGRERIVVTILTSIMDGTNLVLTLKRPLWADMIDELAQAVVLVPGCDRQASTCIAKFDNYAKFRGMPFIPDYLETVDAAAPRTPRK